MGDWPVVARRISFSVRARCSASFKRSLSDCSEWVLDSRADSFASRSRTWRSLRSRKARCLHRQESAPMCPFPGQSRRGGHDVRCAVLGLPPALSRRQACFLLLAAAPRPARPRILDFAANAAVYAADLHRCRGHCGVGAPVGGRQPVAEREGVVGTTTQKAGLQRFLQAISQEPAPLERCGVP